MPGAATRPSMTRFLVLFPLGLILGFALLQTGFAGVMVERLTEAICQVSASLIRLFGGHVVVAGRVLRSPVNGFGVQVQNGCNAINVSILLWTAIAAYPASWIQKGGGLLCGTVAIHAVNLVRLISLYYLGQYNAAWFEFAHLYLWEGLIVLDTLVVFWIWAALVRHPAVHGNAAA